MQEKPVETASIPQSTTEIPRAETFDSTTARPTTANTTTTAPATAAPAAAEAPATVAPIPAATTAASPAEARPRQRYALHKTRWIIRAITFVAEFIPFFITVGLAAECHNYGGAVCDPFLLFFIGLPMLWNIAEFITLCVNHKGIHPGAHIAADLIWFGFLLGPAITYTVVLAYDYSYDYNDCGSSDLDCPSPYRAQRRRRLASVYAELAFMILAGILHFVLFVLACIAVHRWRMQRQAEREERLRAIYAGNNLGPGALAYTANMDPNQAYLVTYPDGRQVLVPPRNPEAAQQYQQITNQYGYYGAQQPQSQAVQPTQQPVQPQQQQQMTQAQQIQQQYPGYVPYSQAQPRMSGSTIPGGMSTAGAAPGALDRDRTNPALPASAADSSVNLSPQMSDSSNTQQQHQPLFHQQQLLQQQQQHRSGSPGAGAGLAAPAAGHNRDSLYEPRSAIEAPEHNTTPRPGEAVPFRES